MYRILIAEDEPEVLNSMLETIDWAHFGFDQPVGCGDGKEAIRRVNEGFIPHAVITDINMPLAGGLEFAEFLHENHPKTLVVILSGYDDFGYAQQALRMKVFDYVLKPVTPAKLENLLERISGQVRQRQMEDPEDAKKIGTDNFLRRLLSGSMEKAVIQENLEKYNIKLEGSYITAAVADIDDPPNSADTQEKTIALMRYGLHNISDEMFSEHEDVNVTTDKYGMTWLIVSGDNSEAACGKAEKYMKELAGVVKKHLKLGISAGIGSAIAGADMIYRSHDSAVLALDNRFYLGRESILRFDTLPPLSSGAFDYSGFEEMFRTAVESFDTEQAKDVLTEMYRAMATSRPGDDQCAKYSQRLVNLLLNFAGEFMGREEMQTLEDAWEHHNLYETMFIDQMEHIVKQFSEQVFELLSLMCNDSTSAQIAKAESYIRSNFSNPKLSLQTVTDYLAVSTSYFSSVFKSRTGLTFVEYLTKLRMDKARQILAHTERRTYEVAEDVGFSDPHYFSAAFKRVTGMTPREYRGSHKEDSIT